MIHFDVCITAAARARRCTAKHRCLFLLVKHISNNIFIQKKKIAFKFFFFSPTALCLNKHLWMIIPKVQHQIKPALYPISIYSYSLIILAQMPTIITDT